MNQIICEFYSLQTLILYDLINFITFRFGLFKLHILMEFSTMMVFTLNFNDNNIFYFICTSLELVSNIVIWLHYDKEY